MADDTEGDSCHPPARVIGHPAVYQSRTVPSSIYFIIIATYFLTIFYSILFNSIGNLAPLTYVQILVDLGLETSIVFVTGGVDSAFSFTFFFSIIAAGIMLFRRGAFLIASLAGIAYGALVDLQYYGIIMPSPDRLYTQSEIFYNIFLNFVAFYTVAFLSEQPVRKAEGGEEGTGGEGLRPAGTPGVKREHRPEHGGRHGHDGPGGQDRRFK